MTSHEGLICGATETHEAHWLAFTSESFCRLSHRPAERLALGDDAKCPVLRAQNLCSGGLSLLMLVTVMDMKEEVGVIDVYIVSLLNRKAKKKKKNHCQQAHILSG